MRSSRHFEALREEGYLVYCRDAARPVHEQPPGEAAGDDVREELVEVGMHDAARRRVLVLHVPHEGSEICHLILFRVRSGLRPAGGLVTARGV